MQKILGILICILLIGPDLLFGEERTVYKPQITREALINPGMGWMYYQYSSRLWAYGGLQKPGDTLDWFPGCSTIYFRLPWCYLEPEEGKFRWDLIDTWAQPWIQKGKKIAFRVMASDPRTVYTTPKWVRDAGAKGIDYPWSKTDLGSTETMLWEPRFDDPVFLKKLDNFLAAFARRYNGNPNVAFIDIGSFGIYGEGHTGRSSKLNQEETNRICKIHIDLHKKHFPDTLLCISDDIAGEERRKDHAEIIDYAFSQGITLRDDSILCGVGPKNEWFSQGLAKQFWPTLPVIVEHGHYIRRVYKKQWTPERLIQAVEDYHASYLSIHDWPEPYLKNHRAIIDKINLRLGYRLELREADFPKSVKLGEEVRIKTKWANVGVAPCYQGGYPSFTLKDEKGRPVWCFTDESFNVRDLPVADPGKAPAVAHQSFGAFGLVLPIPTINEGVILPMKELGLYPDFGENVPTLKPGQYTLYLSVGKPDGTPQIALPIEGQQGDSRYYRLGSITIKP
ncbi:MAG: DUF4832 domain-containing protein [Planctomycetia bacterium]|nr:DUF4832 domain-containing protein [Planctomycetia bacterium]